MSMMRSVLEILVYLATGYLTDVETEGPYFKNYNEGDLAVNITSYFPSDDVKHYILDLNSIKLSQLTCLNETIINSIAPELIPVNWQSYDFYLYDDIFVSDSVNSYIVCALSKSLGVEESFGFMLNIKDGYLKSIATLSYRYHLSSTDFGSMYSVIQRGTISMYESLCRIDDNMHNAGAEIPWYIAMRRWLYNLFSKKKKHYTQVLLLKIDADGYLHNITREATYD